MNRPTPLRRTWARDYAAIMALAPGQVFVWEGIGASTFKSYARRKLKPLGFECYKAREGYVVIAPGNWVPRVKE